MTDWHRLGIGELQAAFAREETKPSRYLDHMLRRIETHNPALNAFVELDIEAAKAAAAESDQRFVDDEQRPLEGVVIGVKANIAVKGMELTAGAEARRGIRAGDDADAVTKLRNAGAIIVGMLNMHEFALGATTKNPWFGTCYNPHGEGLSPGGSSGGSGAAVSAGLCTAALGTDTLGSIRIPASFCGIYGIKPTHGAVSPGGLVPLSNRFDAIGPMARTLEDVSILSHILFSPDLSTAMRRTRYLQIDKLGGVDCQPDVAAAFADVLQDFAETPGVVELAQPLERIRTAAFALTVRELIAHLVQLGEERCAQISPDVEFLIDFALSRSDADLAEDERIVTEVGNSLHVEIASNGILVLPTAPRTAFPQNERAPSNIADFTALANIAGLPALTLPLGNDQNGLPMGVQLIGPAGGEAMIIAQARMLNDKIRGYSLPDRYA